MGAVRNTDSFSGLWGMMFRGRQTIERSSQRMWKELLTNSGLGNLLFSSSNASLFFLDVFTSCEQWEKWTNFLGKWTFYWLKYVKFLFHM